MVVVGELEDTHYVIVFQLITPLRKNGVSKIMTDKELLELAAKVAGIEIKHWLGSEPYSPVRTFESRNDDERWKFGLRLQPCRGRSNVSCKQGAKQPAQSICHAPAQSCKGAA